MPRNAPQPIVYFAQWWAQYEGYDNEPLSKEQARDGFMAGFLAALAFCEGD